MPKKKKKGKQPGKENIDPNYKQPAYPWRQERRAKDKDFAIVVLQKTPTKGEHVVVSQSQIPGEPQQRIIGNFSDPNAEGEPTKGTTSTPRKRDFYQKRKLAEVEVDITTPHGGVKRAKQTLVDYSPGTSPALDATEAALHDKVKNLAVISKKKWTMEIDATDLAARKNKRKKAKSQYEVMERSAKDEIEDKLGIALPPRSAEWAHAVAFSLMLKGTDPQVPENLNAASAALNTENIRAEDSVRFLVETNKIKPDPKVHIVHIEVETWVYQGTDILAREEYKILDPNTKNRFIFYFNNPFQLTKPYLTDHHATLNFVYNRTMSKDPVVKELFPPQPSTPASSSTSSGPSVPPASTTTPAATSPIPSTPPVSPKKKP